VSSELLFDDHLSWEVPEESTALLSKTVEKNEEEEPTEDVYGGNKNASINDSGV